MRVIEVSVVLALLHCVEINKYVGETAFDVFIDRIIVGVSQKKITCQNDSVFVGTVHGANRPYVRHIRGHRLH